MTPALKAHLQRLLACLFGGVVLAIVIGPQEGTLTDFGVAFRQAVSFPRILVFLAIGALIFVAMTFWARIRPYLFRPGMLGLLVGLLTVVISQFVMNWFDPLGLKTNGNVKYNNVRKAVAQSTGIHTTTTWFFNWLSWTLLAIAVVAIVAAVVSGVRALGYVATVAGIIASVLAYTAHQNVVHVGSSLPGFDHSLGMYADIIGFLVLAGTGIVVALATREKADPRAFLYRIDEFRPGLPLAVLAIILGLFALISDCWFSPNVLNATLSDSHRAFKGTGLSSIGSQYLAWLGWALFIVAAVLALVAVWFGQRIAAYACGLASIVGIVLTFITIHSMTNIGAAVAPKNGKNWANLGVGGYMQCLVFAFFAAAVVDSAVSAARGRQRQVLVSSDEPNALPVTAIIGRVRGSSRARSTAIAVLALALFYPPMLTTTWQNVLVGQIGVFVLLSIGLNVVVGWAGLLDLGYIAFYEIGAYTTAYLTGALPRKPPSWLHMTPILAIPFAIVACLIAGLILGAPTLRLRGDYLAIVTLGFGEIIQVVALNNPGNLTNGAQGPTIGHPKIHIGGLHITWGEDYLPYWYLLLIMLIIVGLLFYRLEGSRLGRAWAAIREDEVAAQASGVSTTHVKLLAFAIGASTSGLAGWFFATQVGYFDPTLFTLQASILIVAYVVFGGMGSLPGAAAGAFVLTWVPQFLKGQVPIADRQMWVGALVLIMMIFRPAGLIPAKRRKAELEGLDAPASSEVRAVPLSEGI